MTQEEALAPRHLDDADLQPGASPSEARCVGAWVLRAARPLERRLAARSFAGDGELVIDA